MRVSPIKETIGRHGASFAERFGAEVPVRIDGIEAEYRRVRDAAGLTDFSHMQRYRVPEETGLDFLDSLFAGNVARVRFGRVLHTFLADREGMLVADCYVANNDDEFIVLCESLVDDAAIGSVLEEYGAAEAGLEDLAGTHAVIGVDGYRSWDVMRALFGAEVLGLPYLSIERCPFEDIEVALLRAGKTGEFGYLVLVPQDKAESLLGALSAEVERVGGGLCGVEVHDTLRLDGRFFNIYAEGRSVGDPLPLGLQWMIDFDKGAYRGSERIAERRSRGVAEKIVGVRADTGAGTLAAGTKLYAGGAEAGDIRVACRSYVLDADMGLGLLPTGMAYAGVTLNLGSPAGPEVRTVSMPPFMPKSLTVKLDEI